MDAKRRVMRNIALFLLILLSLLMQEQGAAGAGPYLGAAYLTCMRNTTSLSSTFTRNLNTTLLNLTSLSSQGTKYAITTAGSSGQEMVYAMFQCRGDQSLQFCWECMQNATARLPQSDCPHSVGARIQLDSCYLRYDNQSFFVLDTTYVIGYCYAPTSDPVALAAIEDLMGNVTSLAPKQGGFASASASGEYAVAQCLGYLNESECSQCLLRYSYRTVCDSTLGEQLHLTSCYYRYEPYSFFDAPSPPPAASPPPSLAPSSAPSLPPPNSQGSKTFITTGSKTLIIVAGVVVGVVIVVGALCATLVRRYKASKVKGGPRVDKSASWSGQLPQTKAQVFSLEELEEATGHFHPSNKLGEGGFGIVYKVWEMYSHERSLDLVDEKLGNVFFPEQVIRLVNVALLCTQENPKQRPAMSMVTLWLSGMSDILEMPLRPTFLDYDNSIASMNEFSQLFTPASSTSSPRAQLSQISGGVQSMSEIVDPS